MDTLDWDDKDSGLPESDPRRNWRVVDILELKTKFNDNVEEAETELDTAASHIANTSNPHSVTKTQVGLGNVDNTSDANKPVSTAQQTAIDAKVSNNLTASTTVAPSKTAVNTALDLKANISDVNNAATIPFGATSGSATYTATMTPTVASYTNGRMYAIRVGTASSGVVTINLDGVGAKKLLLATGIQANDGHLIPADYLISYNSALDSGAGAFVVVNELQHGLMNARGDYNAVGNIFPTIGGSGPGGTIRHGDTFRISGAGTLNGQAVNIGDFITTSVDEPIDALWYVIPGINTSNAKLTKANLILEFPTGTINGVNLVFTLANAANILILFSDGGALDPNQDFEVVGTTINLVAPPYTAFFALTKS